MYKLIKILLVLIFSTQAYAYQFEWKLFSTTHRTEFYLDTNNIVEVENYIYFWSLANNLDEINTSGNPLSTLTLNGTNCDSYENSIISYTGYSEFNLKGDILINVIIPDVDPSMFKWTKFNKENSFFTILEYICNN